MEILKAPEPLCLPCMIHPYVYCKCGWKICVKHRLEVHKGLYQLHECIYQDQAQNVELDDLHKDEHY